MVVIAMMKTNHEQFVEQLQCFIVELVEFIEFVEQIVANPLLMKNEGFLGLLKVFELKERKYRLWMQ